MILSAFRRLGALLAFRILALALTGAIVAGCSSVGGVGDGGALFTGKERLAPLHAAPPEGKPTIQILPYTGLPVTIGDEIYKRFRIKAAAEGLELINRLEDPATYRVQGHFVALGQDTSSTVIYSYDVYDASGAKVHRFVGQEISSNSSGDAWSAVGSEIEQHLAERAVWGLKAWLTRADR